jgi:GNAT superfamily N-acetyltransferase
MTGEAFTIASARPGDAGDIHALVRALADYEKLDAACVSTAADIDRALFGPRPAAEALVARKNGNSQPAVGFALFFHTFSTFLGRRSLWLEDLFVRPEHRGGGIGRALLTAVAAIACDRQCGRFEWAVLDWNESAIRFYEAQGAVVLPDWRIARVTGGALERLAAGSVRSPSP